MTLFGRPEPADISILREHAAGGHRRRRRSDCRACSLRARPEPAASVPPPCPTCGAPAVGISVGVVIEEREKGMTYVTSRAAPGAPPQVECAEGHWYIVQDGAAVASDGPRTVQLIKEPRRH